MRWNGNGVADGTALTAGNVNTAGNGDTVTRSVSGTPTKWNFRNDGFEVNGTTIIARLDGAGLSGRGGVGQMFFTGIKPGSGSQEIMIIRGSTTRLCSLAYLTTGAIAVWNTATTVLATSPVLGTSQRYQMDLIAQQNTGTPSTTNGRAVCKLTNLDDPAWNTTGVWYSDSTGVNVGTEDLNQIRVGRTATTSTQGSDWIFENFGWDNVALPSGTTGQTNVEPYFMVSPYSRKKLISVGSTLLDVSKIKIGTADVSKVYVGSTLVYG